MTEVLPNQFRVEHQEGRDLRITDPGIGYAYGIGRSGVDAVFYDVFTSPIALRSLDICQLSKGKLDDTILGLESFRRFQTQAGNYEAVRHFGNQLGLDAETLLTYSLAATLFDFAHGVKSHGTDIMVEGVGGREEFHEGRTQQAIDSGGLSKVFDKHGIRKPRLEKRTLKGKFGVPIPSWVENDNGEPNIDRVVYVAGESRIWFPGNELVRAATSLDAVRVNEDGQFVFKDHDLARTWGKVGLLLSSEHWNDPVNRLILLISVETIKRTIFNRYLNGVDDGDNGNQSAPEDYTFFCDSDFDQALREHALDKHHPDGFMTGAYHMLQALGHTERVRFATHKKQVYEEFLADQDASEYPSQYVNPHIAKFGPAPVFVEVVSDTHGGKATRIEGRGRLLTDDGEPIGYLKNFKIRQFDPLVVHKGQAVPLSSVDSKFAGLLEQHRRAITYTQAMKLLMNTESKTTFCSALKENEQAMRRAKEQHKPLSPDQLRRVINGAGSRAVELAIRNGIWQDV